MDIFKKRNQQLNVTELVETINRISPNFMNLLEDRFNMLRIIDFLQPIGRRKSVV